MKLTLPIICIMLSLLSACDSQKTNNDTKPSKATSSKDASSPTQQEPTENYQSKSKPAKEKQAPTKQVTEINWDDLIPKEALPDPDVVEQYNNGELDDSDPKMIALRKKIKDLEEKAPVNNELDGQTIKIPGFLVPVEMDGEKVKEFLLVPYQGACIHVPPPPANQTIFVKANEQSAKAFKNFDTVWVTGEMRVEKQSLDLADTGFTVNSATVTLYE